MLATPVSTYDGTTPDFKRKEIFMKRSALHVRLSVAIVALMFVAAGSASAQMMGGHGQSTGSQGQMGQGQMQQEPMPMHQDMQSMQGMMQQMQGMMTRMQGMMHGNQGMMANQGMSGMNGPGLVHG
jgi:TolA-binding protein